MYKMKTATHPQTIDVCIRFDVFVLVGFRLNVAGCVLITSIGFESCSRVDREHHKLGISFFAIMLSASYSIGQSTVHKNTHTLNEHS